MIVTIDGPAGSGKSTAARELAERLRFEFLDTGAMYRAVTLAGLREGCDFSCAESTKQLLSKISIAMPPGKVLLGGEDVTRDIRKPEVTDASAQAANSPEVRQFLVELQRHMAAGRNIVTEGRDQGTIVFPEANCKFFLVADPKERARRRFEELRAKGEKVTLEEIYQAQQERDDRDAHRHIAPMVPAPEAITIDTTQMTVSQVARCMEQEVRKCLTA